ncbi:MAG: fibronectin type III domain-containing protein [bacterium]|nr:fibronectin type III domain-containing protein [bacterium]
MRKRMTRITSLVAAASIACSMFVSPVGITAYAKTARLTSEVGYNDVTGLRVPTLAYDETSISLVWDKPEKYDNIADYNVYMDGKFVGTARESYEKNAEWASAYMNSFYEGYAKKDVDMVDVDIHSYKATGLKPATQYEFEVRPVNAAGKELGTSKTIKQTTAKTANVCNIVDFGAKASEKGYTYYNDEINQLIVNNTKAIQAAIDDCEDGGTVVIPKGIYMSGAIYLKSNMTLELQEGAILWGSPNTDHYEHNYLLYPYSTDTRAWALVNAYSADENQMLENIRITGQGTIYGNGFKYGKADAILGDGVSEVQYQSKNELDPADDKYKLEQWVSSSNVKVSDTSTDKAMDPNKQNYGVLAKDAFDKAKAEGKSDTVAYASRPNLVALRGVNGIYVEGVTFKNPAFHTLAILDSKNVVSADVKYITYDCNNADGIEIGNTENALIYNNFFDTGDDSINFATGLGNGVKDAEQQPSSKIWTFNNFIRNGHGGAIAAGSHTGAGICDMLVEDNVINLNEMPFRFKSAPVNGGGIYNVTIRDCAVANCKQLFVMTTSYGDANQAFAVEPADKPAEFYNISAYNITADTISKNSFYLMADVAATYKPWHTHHNLYFEDITCTNITTQKSELITGCEDVEFKNVSLNWNASKVATPAPWSTITYSKDIKFTGTTTLADKAKDAMAAPIWGDAKVSGETMVEDKTSYKTASTTLTWDAATDNTKVASYSVDVYVGDTKVDQIDDIKNTNYTVTGLSIGVDYTYKVYASDATGNKTEGPVLTQKSAGEKDTTAILTSENKEVTFSGEGYTWALAKFANAKVTDERVRGYKVYVNGKETETFYNYKIQNSAFSETISQNVRRMTAGKDNSVKIVAFTDAGLVAEYKEATVKTTENYDHKAPVWSKDAKITVTQKGTDLVLSWPKATDDTAVLGYRVYVDRKPMLADANKEFNQVNGNLTTTATTYTVKGLDLTKEHTFKVEAGDTWWKAAAGEGPFHWTFSGPTATYKQVVTPVVPVTVSPVKGFKASTSTATTATVVWTKAADVTGYVLTYKDAAGKTVTKTLKASQTSYKVSGLCPATSYAYSIKAYKTVNNKPVYSSAVNTTVKTTALAKVTTFKATKTTNQSMTLNWNKAAEASGYVITYKNALNKTSTTNVNSGTKTSANVANLLGNKSYTFTIKPYVVVNGKKVYAAATTKSFKTAKTVKPGKVEGVSAKKASKTSANISYKKAKNAAGYEIAYSTKKSSGFKKVSVGNVSKTKISKLKSKSTYYVKVRGFSYENKVVKGKVVKTKVYGAYSSVKKVSLK